MSPHRRRSLLLDLAVAHVREARLAARLVVGALRDAAIAALLSTRDDDDISLPSWRARRDAESGPRITGRGGDA